ncbi:MAG TPA: phosphoribosylformylglycinamidine synthase [Acidimicrobiaceae bacterium]|jgi:phosphoribosylformylglycinamidine synthase PurS subunit|nr:phosphoribosylformylglycinamidine synthase [Acidimicrobiaceae bacterium]
MIFACLVDVQLRPGIADPQGSTIERSAGALGFPGVSGVRVGKSIRFDLEAVDEHAARAEVEDLCAKFLTNPVIETAAISLHAAAE